MNVFDGFNRWWQLPLFLLLSLFAWFVGPLMGRGSAGPVIIRIVLMAAVLVGIGYFLHSLGWW